MSVATVLISNGEAVCKNNPMAIAGYMSDSTGTHFFQPDALARVMTYTPNGSIESITLGPDPLGKRYRQTYTYTHNNLTSVSAWEVLVG